MTSHYTDEQRRTEEAQKREFARLLFEAGPSADTFTVGFQLFPDNPNRAVLAGGNWRADPLVISELAQLRAEQTITATQLPGQEDLARHIWLKMQECDDPDAFVKLAKLYAEVQGMIKKPTEGTNNNVPVRHVMMVTDHGDELNWEQKLLANQNQLQEDGLKEIRGERVAD